MAESSITSDALRVFRASGLQDDGAPSETVACIVRNPEWSVETRDDEPRYYVYVYVDGDESNSDTSNSKTDAVDVAKAFMDSATSDYEAIASAIREERSESLLSACREWYEDDGREVSGAADRSAVEHVAAALAEGKGLAVLAALRAAGLAD
jgi:hypothetical protein